MTRSLKYLCVVFAVWTAIGLIVAPSATPASTTPDQELFLVAQKAFEDGFYDVAIRYLNQLQTEFPEHERMVEAQLLLGQCYFFKNQYLKAYETFDPLLNENQYKDATLFWLGETYLKGSDYPAAEKHYSQLMKLYPDSIYAPQAQYSLGWVYYEQGEYAKAKTAFQGMVDAYPLHQLQEDALFKIGECEFNLKNFETTAKFFTQFLEKNPQTSREAEAMFYIAESFYYSEKYPEAITYYARVADSAYDSKLALMGRISLGWSYLKLEKYDLSQKAFDGALTFANQKGILTDDIYLGQANLYTEMKNYDAALKANVALIENFPNSHRLIEAYLGKANNYYLLKNYPKAILSYQTVIDKYQGQPLHKDTVDKAYFGLAWSYLKSGNIDKSVSIFEAIKDKAESIIVKISALTQIGDAYQDVSEFEKALEVYDSILGDYPDSIYTDYVQYRQGIALLKMEKLPQAKMSFQTLQSNFPNSKYYNDSLYYLAVAYFQEENWRAAQEIARQFLERIPEESEFKKDATYLYGLCYYGQGNHDEAVKIFQRIIKNYPQYTELIPKVELSLAKAIYKKGDTKDAVKRLGVLNVKYEGTEIGEEALLWLADHYLEHGEFETAAAHYEEFIKRYKVSKRLSVVYYQLGQAYHIQKKFDQAVEAYKNVSIIDGKDLFVKAKLAIADIFSEEADTEQSIETYRKIIATSPEYKRDAYVKIATVYKKAKNYDDAAKSYTRALEAEDSFNKTSKAEVQFLLGDIYELKKEPEKALEEYLKIPYLYPKDTAWIVKALLRSAKIYENSESWKEAQKIYEKVIPYETDEKKFAMERLEWITEISNSAN